MPLVSCSRFVLRALLVVLFAAWVLPAQSPPADEVVRVFVFAGQSNMVGSDSRVADVAQFPPFADAVQELPAVRYWYVVGREDKERSAGFVPLRPIGTLVGPELTFAREVLRADPGPLAIVKIAAGGTSLAVDWNPEQPGGFQLYPLALATVREALAELDRQHVRWRLEGVCWHQGENDMFDDASRRDYGRNLAQFVARWRRDLAAPQLRFYVGELCTKTIWGMDNRMPMHGIERGQREVADADPLVDYVPTSQVAVEVGGDAGLHYHYGTLGQLEHGVEYARAYLQSRGKLPVVARPLLKWPYAAGSTIDLYVLAGHRNMEGERAFTAQLASLSSASSPGAKELAADQPGIAFTYATGGGVHRSDGFEPLGPAGRYGTFGPELSFGRTLAAAGAPPFALAKFTHSGAQLVDFTEKGSDARTRNLYPTWLSFVRASIAALEQKGNKVRLAGVVYHLAENDMAWRPFRQRAIGRLREWIDATRRDLAMPQLAWFVSQQTPPNDGDLAKVDVVAELRALAASDGHVVYVDATQPPPQAAKLVFDAAGIVWLGEQLAAAVHKQKKP